MKELLGCSYEQLTTKLHITPVKHYYSPDNTDGFSIFIHGNEYLFNEGDLFSIEIVNFQKAKNIHKFELPIIHKLEEFLALLTLQKIEWEVLSKYSRQHWVVIKLLEQGVLYEFDFSGTFFNLQFMRIES